jgi:hypothetical protein
MTERKSRAQPRGRRVEVSSKGKRPSASKRATKAASARARAAEAEAAPPPHPTEARGTLSPTGMEQDPLQ